MQKVYTVEEANRTLPLVRRIATDIVSAHRELVELAREYRSLGPEPGSAGSGRRELEQEMRDLTKTVNAYVAELEEVGALFKGFEDGLVDFYGMLDGRPIFLCWKLDEERIEWWHELDGGFAGRRRLPEHLLSVGGV